MICADPELRQPFPHCQVMDSPADAADATGAPPGRSETVLPELATTLGLTPDLLPSHPHEVSNGQLQRACLARALVLRPRWLVCDEMTAMLDAAAALFGLATGWETVGIWLGLLTGLATTALPLLRRFNRGIRLQGTLTAVATP
ncbi:ATP-binding cassette domain-containing protein [Streptomyces sp. NBC_01538]|uniref:ATP-binding cassette domain-containing protein n=1 Tax=Streptomyces sp. NBC_01538 TaxID=2903897 RepID=UPI003862E36D